MADFVLKKHVNFHFTIEGVEEGFDIPALGSLPFDDVDTIQKITDLKLTGVERGKATKQFIQKYCEGIEKTGIGDIDYNLILSAYIESQDAKKKK